MRAPVDLIQWLLAALLAAVIAIFVWVAVAGAQTPGDSLRTELVRSRGFIRGAHTQLRKTRAILDRHVPLGTSAWSDSLRSELIRAQGMASGTNTQLTKTLAVLDRHRGAWVAADAAGWTWTAPLLADDHTPDPERRRVVVVVPFDTTGAALARVVITDSLGRVLSDSLYAGTPPLLLPDSLAVPDS